MYKQRSEARLMTCGEVSELLGLHLLTVYRLGRDGKIPGRVQLGSKIVRYRSEIIKRWIQKNTERERIGR